MTGDDGRPSPDDLLSLAREDDRRKTEGRLTVYLGYAAGVGKTYTMLTEGLAARLESIPAKVVDYQGISLPEMDLDAVLARNPAVVLVDELAHTLAPGQRHAKRYQEIEELLRAGISVGPGYRSARP